MRLLAFWGPWGLFRALTPPPLSSLVCLWPISEVAAHFVEVRLLRHSGLDLLRLSSSHFDPLAEVIPNAAPCFGMT